MTEFQRSVAGKLERIEARFDWLKRRLGHSLGGRGVPVIIPYRSYGNRERLLVKGRILEAKEITAALAEDSIWQNLLNTYRRMESDEVAGARVEASAGGVTAETVSDEEGYFQVWLEGATTRPEGGWHEVEVRLGDVDSWQPAVAPVLVPHPRARFGVISDIDDTVMLSYATELIRVARLTFLGNARTRLPFPGVAAFYRALCQGKALQNPLFYVSSSPWNLYDLLEDFFRLQEIPAGPMFLRDWGISREEFLPSSHSSHKLDAIERLFEFYGQLSFILIGDSGQEDPEIYAEIVRRHPNRVLAVYIRDVSEAVERDNTVLELAKEVAQARSTLILAQDTMAMAQHAADNGWIEQTALGEIRDEIEVDSDESEEPVI